jgi:hypothetical protein
MRRRSKFFICTIKHIFNDMGRYLTIKCNYLTPWSQIHIFICTINIEDESRDI